jgi:hypothetical protein
MSSIKILGEEIPGLLTALHHDLGGSGRDLERLAKAHTACADVAPLFSQVRPEVNGSNLALLIL